MSGKLPPPPSTYILVTISVPIIIWDKPARTGSKLESGMEGDFNSWRNWNQFKHNCTCVLTRAMRNRKLGELEGAAPSSDAQNSKTQRMAVDGWPERPFCSADLSGHLRTMPPNNTDFGNDPYLIKIWALNKNYSNFKGEFMLYLNMKCPL